MQYLITFLEGLISFISPCMLPMLPLYVSYFAGGEKNRTRTAVRAAAFVLGFTVTFMLLGLFAGSLGVILNRYRTAVNIVTGALVILFGLSYLEVIRLPFFTGMKRMGQAKSVSGAFLFGLIYSVSLTPCVGAFLGSALMLASSAGSAGMGVVLLLCYSLGLGVPFVISAMLLERLGDVFGFIKRNYRTVNAVCGGFLILLGLLMMTGLLGRAMALLQ